MARIVGVDLPPQKRIIVGLTYIYGIGPALSEKILAKTGIDPDKKSKDLTEGEILKLREILKDIKVEGDLRKDITMNIKRLMDIGAYRGLRHKKGLPARGQRTRTHARTRRGKRKTVGSGRKKEEKT
ncbi:MAG TPA: 30S ribosomal protein S13 [Candidatus Omnitrophota bacterium]|nr:30S ribosomal protein S13 [Candidatus Omnitrophota bacterium]